MLQIIEQTDQEKFDMYNKLSKKELIIMLIEANKHLSRPVIEERQKTYGDVCSCNPANGGSGVCGCTIANNPIRTAPVNIAHLDQRMFTNLTYSTCKNCNKLVQDGEWHNCRENLNANYTSK